MHVTNKSRVVGMKCSIVILCSVLILAANTRVARCDDRSDAASSIDEDLDSLIGHLMGPSNDDTITALARRQSARRSVVLERADTHLNRLWAQPSLASHEEQDDAVAEATTSHVGRQRTLEGIRAAIGSLPQGRCRTDLEVVMAGIRKGTHWALGSE